MCQYLSDEMKDEFQEKVDRSNTKSKLNFLFSRVNYYTEALEYAKQREDLFTKFALLKLLFDQYMFWKDFSFLLTFLINLLILSTYYKIDPPSENYSYAFGYDSENEAATKSLMNGLAIMQLIVSILILLNYIVKSISKYTWKYLRKGESVASFKQSGFKSFLIFIYRMLQDVDLIYNIAYTDRKSVV